MTRTLFTLAMVLVCASGHAGQGRLLATGGATQVEGSAGGGTVPWAVIAGYGARGQMGATAFFTRIETNDYALNAWGAAAGLSNRVELSVARQRLDIGTLGIPFDALRQDIAGIKVRVLGDLIYGRLPQVALGAQYKRVDDFALPSAVAAERRSDVDFYLSAARLFLAGAAGRNLLVNTTLRYSRANQGGLLGFGGDLGGSRSLLVEGSVAMLLNPRWALGVEYRQKPDNLSFAGEDDWKNAFVAWFPNKNVSLVGSWVDLGSIANRENQQGLYLSLQVGY